VANKALAFSHQQYSETDPLPAEEKERNHKLAIKYYKEAFRRNPKHYIAYNNLGNLYLQWTVKTLTGRDQEKKNRSHGVRKRRISNPYTITPTIISATRIWR
jgi:hypothetical protein